ncbi:translation initiation factor IF-3, partial [Candidatus Micrarchaeota archaeon]|nr:translation initiation factor IF-3 [Candidatus Micrarchaeota archaeon]
MSRENLINEEIRDRELRIISQDGEQLGIMSRDEALKLAEEKGLDLVNISPSAKPP